MHSQEKSKILYRNEVVSLTNKGKLEIESFIEEQREIAKSKNVDELIVTNLDGKSAFPAKLEAVKK